MSTKKIFMYTLTLAIGLVGFLAQQHTTGVDGFIQLPFIEEKDPTSHTGYKVVRVVDGDTIDVEIDGKKESIRFVGINTPESVDPRRPVQCFGREASKKMKELLSGEYVILKQDTVSGDRDKYGRLLRYVYRESDNLFLNQEMIKQGYAYEYTYKSEHYQFQAEFKQLQKDAQLAGLGLWNKDTCNGKK